ncbi:MAG TPA: NAD(+)/NADH kinase [Dehalococcoidia bacterium]|nr:NAD(+)/NADH kinase [Dehalococcoidia bacterium]
MALVGIIANPAASKDIRRLVAQGRVVPDWEKVNILRRVLLGLEAVGVDRVVAMPDSAHLAQRAREDASLSLELELLEMAVTYSEDDTTLAARRMAELGVSCLVTLGGDGTNRAVAKGCTTIPLVAISTGTNNVFPTLVEGTLAGLAAGLVAQGRLEPEGSVVASKTLEVYVDGQYRDLALVDVALSRERFVGTRAIWDLGTLYEVFLTRAEPAGIGLSSVGARLAPVSLSDAGGLHYVLAGPPDAELQPPPGDSGPDYGPLAAKVLAPIAPGVILWVPIARWQRLAPEQRVAVARRHCTVALDGERAFTVTPQQQVEAVLLRAAQLGLFRA